MSKQVAPGMLQRAVTSPGQMTPIGVQVLQSVFGNRAVARLLPQPPSRLSIQAKLTVTPSGDQYEREADRVAVQVSGQIGAFQTPAVQSQEEDAGLQPSPAAGMRRHEHEEEAQMMPVEGIHRLPDGGMAVTPEVESAIQQGRGGGQPLEDGVRKPMESALGADLSKVRVHTDADAVQMAQKLQAESFTHDSDIYFGAGRYAPGNSTGTRLLAHELTHVVQQRGGRAGAGAAPPAIQRWKIMSRGLKEALDLPKWARRVIGALGVLPRFEHDHVFYGAGLSKNLGWFPRDSSSAVNPKDPLNPLPDTESEFRGFEDQDEYDRTLAESPAEAGPHEISMKYAIGNVKNRWIGRPYNLAKRNCQHFAAAVKKEYKTVGGKVKTALLKKFGKKALSSFKKFVWG